MRRNSANRPSRESSVLFLQSSKPSEPDVAPNEPDARPSSVGDVTRCGRRTVAAAYSPVLGKPGQGWDANSFLASEGRRRHHFPVSWLAVSATVLPLAGVALGTAGTLLGQRMTTRADLQRATAERSAAVRAERKDAIIGYLAAAENIEQLRGASAGGHHQVDKADLAERAHALWLAKKLIELVCSADLAQAAQDYTRALDSTTWALADQGWKGASRALSPREHELRVELMETARRELGYHGAPLLRRSWKNSPSDPLATL